MSCWMLGFGCGGVRNVLHTYLSASEKRKLSYFIFCLFISALLDGRFHLPFPIV